MIQAVIFDLDGTVINSTENDFLAWQRMFGECGVTFPYNDYLRVVGSKGAAIVEERVSAGEEERMEMLRRQEAYFKENCLTRGLTLIPGVEELLRQIRQAGLKTALATGSSNEKLAFVFDRVDIRHYFDKITTADTVQKGKPDPEVFAEAARQLNVPPAYCLVVEDAPLGVEAARAGGMQCLAVTTTHTAAELSQASQVVDAYREVDIRRWQAEQAGG